MFKKIIFAIIIILTLYNVGSVVVSHWSEYSSHNYWQRFPQIKQSYLDSQYVNKHPKGWIPDEGALSYAGGALIQGINPVLVIADTPPLGKYLIGLSAVLFDNEHMVSLLFGLASLVFLFLLGRQIFKTTFFALLIPCVLSFEPIFKNQLIYTPLLDIMQLVFLLGSFYFFNKGFATKKTFMYFLLANIFLGLFISTKFYITGTTIIGAEVLVLLSHRSLGKGIRYLLTLPSAILVLFLSYIRIFAYGYSLKSLFGIQKYIFLYHKSQLILPFSIWPLLLFDRWYVWFGTKPVITDAQWSITWPIITIGSFIIILLYLFKKIAHKAMVEVMMLWIILYILFFSFGQITSRYLVIYIPVLYLVFGFGVEQVIMKNSHIAKWLDNSRKS